tara:strand:+ start:76 stop:729 length:654 start_codon:yes stop_codon:yes gene_type:complete
MKKVILIIGLLILNNSYADIPTEEFAECSIIKTPTTKIKCFDSIAEKYNLNKIENSEIETQDLGDWEYNFYVDDFGDKTDQGYIALRSIGKYSNSATTDNRLHVRMYLSDGSLENPWFRLWRYDYSNQVKNTYSIDNYDCRFKDNNDKIFEGTIYQQAGWDYLRIEGRKVKKEVGDLISNEGLLKIACFDRDNKTTKYVFELNFRNFSKVLYAFENQ